MESNVLEAEENRTQMIGAAIGPDSKIISELCLPPSTFKKTVTSTGVRISTQVNDVNEELCKGVEGFDEVKNPDNLASVESNMKFKEEMVVGGEGNESKGSVIFDLGNLDKKVEMVDDMEIDRNVRNKEEAEVGCEGDESKGSEILENGKLEKGEMVDDAMQVEPNLKIKEKTFMGKEENVVKGPESVDEEKSEKEKDDMKVKEEKNESLAEKEVVDRTCPMGTVGKWKLSFDEWLDLPENQSKVKKDICEEVEKSKSIEIKKEPFDGCKNEEISEKGKELSVIPLVKNELYAKVKEEAVILCEKNESMQEKQVARDCKNIEQSKGSCELSTEEWFQSKMKKLQALENPVVKEEKMEVSAMPEVKNEGKVAVKMEADETICVQPLSARPLSDYEYKRFQNSGNSRYMLPKPERADNRALSTVVIEDGDFPEEPDWLLVGRNVVMGLSTSKGRKLENNEIVHFAFPNLDARYRAGSRYGSSKAGSGIVRFSTKRNGEIGRLPMEWGNCLIPLVNSSKVKVLGRCVSAPTNLHLMQEIMLYLSFYIHHTVFTDGDKSSWRLDCSANIDTTTYPLLTLFKLLKIHPFQKAEFTPEELDSRKRHHMFEGEVDENAPIVKRIRGVQPYTEHKEEQAISESTLNKLVGASDMYDLKEMEAPDTLTCYLRPYQKQALFWMTELEKCVNVEEVTKTLHPCWGSYRICDERAPAIHVNAFSGEATTKFPSATKTARGGILADAMGLGKTVMTIALLLARPGRGIPEKEEAAEDMDDTEYIKKRRKSNRLRVRGGTLIVCPMALLGQWKDELEAHSKADCLSVCVHYGGDRSNDPNMMAGPDVILTTYGVLMAAYKNNGEDSIFHKVDWHRVVLDEAHTIKSSRSLGARAAFALSSYCKWCLTGTPLQNNLEDLYSLLCFLHIEPWCNWAWWQKLIQKPYENGDLRGLKLVKAILRPLMLRRTKETKDREGRPILVLPPTDIKITVCEQSEAEHDFYDALFKRSKVQFDQFVAQGKVLHNYANILELLLRLRQCCNHPFLVMSRGDTQKYADLNKLARQFFETNSDSSVQNVPSRAYVEEVVEGLRNGENTECPICLESADDPVLTPCAHKMCRECLLSSWRSPAGGACPICRQLLKKTELITCPSENRFRIDIEKNWKESSKVSKLLNVLEKISRSGSGEKSIIFSQWTSFLDLLEIPLRRRNIGFLRFDGKLAQKQRERVLKEFNETGDKMVMLMSLKAGGVGLNLTAASNVFLMDPWWNPAVEEQAIMRIHRIGQKRTVHVRRFIVKDTVEERMQQVQARKQRMIAGALTDEEVRSARIEELKMLFR